MKNTNITICLTIGRRPELLSQTLTSLGPLISIYRVLAINDFGDEATNKVFKALCPRGELLQPGRHLGHHAAVDFMYKQVNTEFIFHCEDDWVFSDQEFLSNATAMLESNSNLTMVCVRDLSDFSIKDSELSKVSACTSQDGISFWRLTEVHPQWHGYTFNPHVTRLGIWRGLEGFGKFKKERHISRYMRSLDCYVAYLNPGACRHIGDDNSVANPKKPSRLKCVVDQFKKLFNG